MPQLNIYTLRPRGALHVGQHGIGQEETACHVPAGTLFAALVATWVGAGGKGERWGELFPRAGAPFLLTSAFPHAGGVRFYPLPQVNLVPLGVEAGERRKELLQIAFVSEGILVRIVAGESLAGYLPPPGRDPGGRLFARQGTVADRPRDPPAAQGHAHFGRPRRAGKRTSCPCPAAPPRVEDG